MELIWYGHSCFKLRFDDGAVLIIDPFLKDNASFTGSGVTFEDAIGDVTHVALTHGHDDHVGDTVEICKARGARLTANFELAQYLAAQINDATWAGTQLDLLNPGGTTTHGAYDLSMTPALHSSSTIKDGVPIYLGCAGGLVITPAEKSAPTIYHMGDTDVMAEFEMIDELHEPQIGLVPIGDRFTMGAKNAAYACSEFFGFQTVIPCHYGTFPIIDQTPDAFQKEMDGSDIEVVIPGIGEPITLDVADEA
ncbi:MAG: metal-dependent hydrolase [Pseudomonadota bacterium]